MQVRVRGDELPAAAASGASLGGNPESEDLKVTESNMSCLSQEVKGAPAM